MSLVTLEEFKAHLDLQNPALNPLLQGILDGVSAAAEARAGRLLGPLPAADADAPVTRTLNLDGRRGVIRIPDCRELVSVSVDGSLLAPTAYRLIPRGAFSSTPEPSTHMELGASGRTLTLTGRFGFAQPPADIKQAVLAWASRAFAEKGANYGDSTDYGEGPATNYFRQSMPLLARTTLERYRVPAF